MMTTSVMAGPATCTISLLKARFVGPLLRRQSVDRVPLASEENTKLVMLKTQRRLSGAGTLMRPSRLVYWSHSVTACSQEEVNVSCEEVCRDKRPVRATCRKAHTEDCTASFSWQDTHGSG